MKRYTRFFKEIDWNSIAKPFSDKYGITLYNLDEIKRFRSKAGVNLKLDQLSNDENTIQNVFEQFIPNKSFTVYRGIGVLEKGYNKLLKSKKYESKRVSSWTLDKKVAEDFADNSWTWTGGPDTEKEDVYQLIIETKIKPNDIIIPYHFLPNDIKKYIGNYDEQKELALKKGIYNINNIERIM